MRIEGGIGENMFLTQFCVGNYLPISISGFYCMFWKSIQQPEGFTPKSDKRASVKPSKLLFFGIVGTRSLKASRTASDEVRQRTSSLYCNTFPPLGGSRGNESTIVTKIAQSEIMSFPI